MRWCVLIAAWLLLISPSAQAQTRRFVIHPQANGAVVHQQILLQQQPELNLVQQQQLALLVQQAAVQQLQLAWAQQQQIAWIQYRAAQTRWLAAQQQLAQQRLAAYSFSVR